MKKISLVENGEIDANGGKVASNAFSIQSNETSDLIYENSFVKAVTEEGGEDIKPALPHSIGFDFTNETKDQLAEKKEKLKEETDEWLNAGMFPSVPPSY